MKREARDKRDLPHPKPVERIELNEENAGRKLIIAVVLLLFGAGMLVYAFMGLLTPETGWQTIEVSGSGGPSCGEEFIFLYELNNSAEAKMVTDIYTDACQKAFRLFNSDQEYEDVTNVRTINLHPNEVLEIDEGLYKALTCFPDSGRRELYLGQEETLISKKGVQSYSIGTRSIQRYNVDLKAVQDMIAKLSRFIRGMTTCFSARMIPSWWILIPG